MSRSKRDSRPGLAIVANVATPYRIHLHRRISRELPELELHSLFTHGMGDFEWQEAPPPEIRPVWFGEPGHDPVHPMYRHFRREWGKGGRMLRYLDQHDIRAVVCNGYHYVGYLRLMEGCRRRRIPLLLRGDSNVRADRTTGARRWAKQRLLNWVFARTALVMPVGSLGEQYFEAYGMDGSRMVRMPLEPDYANFTNVDPGEVDAFRSSHELHRCRRWLIFSGRLARVKRPDLLIDAMNRVAGEMPDWGVMIAGKGPMREELEMRVDPSWRDRVRWLGFLDVPQMRLAYKAADLLVLPSEFEPWALVVNEALAAGLAVVCSDVVGAGADLVREGVNGRVFRSGNLESLIDALRDVMDPQRLDRYRGASAGVLEQWRRENDPVAGLRAALSMVGAL